MDWDLAIRRNRDQIREIVLVLFALAGMRVGGLLFMLPRDVVSAIMMVLRPAESAVRRLIVIAAHGLVLKPQTPRPFVILGHRPEDPVRAMPYPIGRTKAFQLFDPLKSFDHEDYWDHARRMHENALRPIDPLAIRQAAIIDTTPVDAKLLGQRLNALMRALDNLPAQARRLARFYAKRDALLKARRPTRCSPMRPGLPPGWRQRRIHEIDEVLRECHGLAVDLLNAPDTS